MINFKKIRDEAAVKYAKKKWVLGQQSVNKDGFKAGADWAIEYLKQKPKTD